MIEDRVMVAIWELIATTLVLMHSTEQRGTNVAVFAGRTLRRLAV